MNILQICRVLEQCGFDRTQISTFVRNELSPANWSCLTDTDLRELGVTQLGRRLNFQKWVANNPLLLEAAVQQHYMIPKRIDHEVERIQPPLTPHPDASRVAPPAQQHLCPEETLRALYMFHAQMLAARALSTSQSTSARLDLVSEPQPPSTDTAFVLNADVENETPTLTPTPPCDVEQEQSSLPATYADAAISKGEESVLSQTATAAAATVNEFDIYNLRSVLNERLDVVLAEAAARHSVVRPWTVFESFLRAFITDTDVDVETMMRADPRFYFYADQVAVVRAMSRDYPRFYYRVLRTVLLRLLNYSISRKLLNRLMLLVGMPNQQSTNANNTTAAAASSKSCAISAVPLNERRYIMAFLVELRVADRAARKKIALLLELTEK